MTDRERIAEHYAEHHLTTRSARRLPCPVCRQPAPRALVNGAWGIAEHEHNGEPCQGSWRRVEVST